MKKILTNFSYSETRNGHVSQWTYPIKGELEVTKELICFGEWKIPNHKINKAVLNTEEIKNIKQQIFLVSCDEMNFMFTFFDIIDDKYQFPFPIIESNNRSAINEMLEGNQSFLQKIKIKFFIAIFIIFVIQYLSEI